MNKLKFSVKSLVEDLWQETKQELHKLGFAIFENAKTNEVVLVHDAELAGIAATEGNETALFDDAKNAAITLMEQHAPSAESTSNDNDKAEAEQVAKDVVASPVKTNAPLTSSASVPGTEAKHDL